MEFSNQYKVGIRHDPNQHTKLSIHMTMSLSFSLKERPLIHRIRFIGINTAKLLLNDADIVHPLNKYNILAVLHMGGYRKFCQGVLTTSFKVINVVHSGLYWPPSRSNWTQGIQWLHKGDQYQKSKETYDHL